MCYSFISQYNILITYLCSGREIMDYILGKVLAYYVKVFLLNYCFMLVITYQCLRKKNIGISQRNAQLSDVKLANLTYIRTIRA